ELYIEDSDIWRFDSPFIYEGENIKGLFLTHEIKMSKSNTRALLELIEDLSRAENWDWEEHPKYDFGLISEFFPEEETEESEE
ncbi:hypothetical protein, partial [Sinorhizobium meliloti]|uniref:hypothetical protein n=1 Tax=Rhizobium meliloti TaxID=382 RepID=UPI0013E40736